MKTLKNFIKEFFFSFINLIIKLIKLVEKLEEDE